MLHMEAELTQAVSQVSARQEVGHFRKHPETELHRARRVSEHLVELGYRLPDCPDRWQKDRLAGAVWNIGRQADDTAYDEWVARNLVRLLKVTKTDV